MNRLTHDIALNALCAVVEQASAADIDAEGEINLIADLVACAVVATQMKPDPGDLEEFIAEFERNVRLKVRALLLAWQQKAQPG